MSEPGAAPTAPAPAITCEEAMTMSERTCSVDGCSRPHWARGFCGSHYRAWWRENGPTTDRPSRARPCEIEGCDKPRRSQGLCAKHLRRLQRHGDPHKGRYFQDDPEGNFWLHVEKGPGCWLWNGHLNEHGYGDFRVNGRLTRAHRFAYELLVGPIPEGLVLDHVHDWGCRNKNCVNPAHLEPVTRAENNRRAREAAA